MPKITTPLTDTEIRKAKPKEKQYKISDGAGLCLIVTAKGSKYFRFDYSYNGKRKSISFGTYPGTSLKEARDKRIAAKELLYKNIDPSNAKQKEKSENDTFENVVNKWLEFKNKEWTSPRTFKNTKANLYNNAIPLIGNKLFKQVTRHDIINIFETMRKRDVNELQRRIANILNNIYRYAITYDIVEHNIMSDIDLSHIINKKTLKHFNAVTNKNEIKMLMEDIKDYKNNFKADISTIYALKLAPYVFLRPYNLRFAEHSEIDLKKGIWEISKEKMKTKKDFVIPLSTQVIKMISEVQQYSKGKSKYLFPSPITNNKPISDSALLHALKRMGYKERMTTHGFRSMFSTIAHEKINEHGHHSDIIELCLAHEERNQVKAAYNRENKMKHYDERKELMQFWADWLDGL